MVEKRPHETLGKSKERLENKDSKNLLIKEGIKEIERLYKALLEITTEGILIHDNGVAVEYNPAFAKMFKSKTEELIGKNVIDTLALPEYRDLIREKMLNGFEQPYEIKAKRKDGNVFSVMIETAREIRYKNRILRIANIRDLTEQKQTGKNFRRNEAFLNAIVENIPYMIFVKDAEELRFVRFNKAGEDLLGYCRKELIGRSDYNLFKKEEADFFTGKDREVLDKRTLLDIPEEPIQTKYKGERILHTKKIPILDEKGKPRYLLGISEDITELKRLEEELRQSQKMESIGTLAGGIAHDFNNVLFSIIGYTDLTMDDVPEGSLAQSNLKEVLIAANRAKDMVKQILAFSRQTETEKKPVKVQAVVKEAIGLLKTSIPTTIEIRQNIDKDCKPVMADPTQIHQVVMNLATNAYHAMREKGGVLAIDVAEEEISMDDSASYPDLHPGTYIKLTVSDTGHGMDKAVMEKIFDPYFTTKPVDQGTGMGLSTIHGIIKSHGGDIKVYSEPGKGTVFHVYFPLIETKPVEPKIVSTGPVQKGNERILFVDDQEPIVRMVKQTLERLGYQVVTRTSSLDALEAFRANSDKFDLVITDMTMPNMTGVELAPRLLEIRPDIPIILCTGFSEITDANKAFGHSRICYETRC